jgi:hypothetical protein
MRELIEKLRAADGPSSIIDEEVNVFLFGGEIQNTAMGRMLSRGKASADFILRLTSSIDDLNKAFERVLPGCGRISGKGRVAEDEPMYGFQIFATDLSPDPLEPIGEGEHDLEAYAYLIAMLQAVEAKRGGAA